MQIALDKATLARLDQIAAERNESPEALAENAVEEAALGYFRRRSDDPGAQSPVDNAVDFHYHRLGRD